MNSTSTYRTSQLHSATTSGFSSSWRKKENTHITHTHTHQPRRYQTCQPNWKLVKRTGECLGPVPLTQLCVEPPTTMCTSVCHAFVSMHLDLLLFVNVTFFVFLNFRTCSTDIPVNLLDLPSHFRSCLTSLPSPQFFGPLESGVPTVTATVSALGLFSLAAEARAAAEWESGPWPSASEACGMNLFTLRGFDQSIRPSDLNWWLGSHNKKRKNILNILIQICVHAAYWWKIH